MRSWLLLTEIPLGVFFVGFNLLYTPPPLPLAPCISTSSVLISSFQFYLQLCKIRRVGGGDSVMRLLLSSLKASLVLLFMHSN